MVTGNEVSNITLTANTMESVEYSERQRCADIINYGPGDVYINWRKEATVGDPSCLLLKEGHTYELRLKSSWRTLNLISASTPHIQLVVMSFYGL